MFNKLIKKLKMKKLVFPLLGLLFLCMSGCMDTGDNIQSYEYVPAVVGYSNDFQPTLITSIGTFLAPELQSVLFTELYEGETILTSFYVNYDLPTSSEYYTAYNVLYGKVEKGWAYSTSEGQTTGGYDVPIEDMALYGGVGNIWFFIFRHTAPSDQSFVYEMTYNSNKTDDVPIVYIRAKYDGQQASGTSTTVDYPYAFDMYYFFSTFKDAENRIKFKIKYKTGVDEDDNDQYSDYYDAQLGAIIDIQIE